MDGIVPIPLLADPLPDAVRHVEQGHRRVVLTRDGAAVAAPPAGTSHREMLARYGVAPDTRRDLDDAV